MIAEVALYVALILVAAKIGAEGAARLKQPPVLGELLAGIVLGNLPWSVSHAIGKDPSVDLLAQLGVLILLFEVGLESTVREVASVGGAAIRVALLGTVGSFAAGWVAARLALPPSPARILLAAAICSTSIGISARVFKDLNISRTKEARTILGACVVDDVLGLLILAVVGSWIRESAASAGALIWLVVKTLGALALAVAIGVRVTPRIFAAASKLRTPGVLLAIGLAFCFFMSWGANALGVAPIIGAFAAGLVLEESHSALFVQRGERSLGQLLEPIAEMLVPIFFVVMGTRADLHALREPRAIALALGLTAAAIVGKAFCAAGAARGTNRFTIALGMLPRGEVTLVFASLGASMTIFDATLYSALVAVVLLTTLLTPFLLQRSVSAA